MEQITLKFSQTLRAIFVHFTFYYENFKSLSLKAYKPWGFYSKEFTKLHIVEKQKKHR